MKFFLARSCPSTTMILACLLLAAVSFPALGQGPDEALDRLALDTGGEAKVSMSRATGLAKFVRLPVAADTSRARGGSLEAKAAAFFGEYGGMFGLVNSAAQLKLVGTRSTGLLTHLKHIQIYENVPIFGGGLNAHFDASGQLIAVNGTIVPDLMLDVTPRWAREAAEEVAIRTVQGFNKARVVFAAGSTLYVFRAGLLQGVQGPTHLVYEVEVVNQARTIREFVYVDAHSGKVVDQITGIHEALNREVSETSLANVVWVEGDPDPIPAGWSGGSTQQVTDWQNEIDGARETYNVFGSMTNGAYLSYDGVMGIMRTVNNDPNIACPNANWNGTSTNYCSDVTGDDTVAHEWGHAYTQFINGLIYQWQGGALSESYSDVVGEIVDFANGRGSDTPGGPRSTGGCSTLGSGNPSVDNTYRWISGEDDPAFNGAIRDLWHPPCYGDPGKVTDSQYWCTTGDSGGVHTNSGIPNHAFALMVDGGTYNGQTITGLGLTKAARIQWESQNLLGIASDFVEHADALETACDALIGATLYLIDAQSPNGVVSSEVISAGDCTEVVNINTAVELRTPPTACNFQPMLASPAPALCGGGAVTTVHLQDFESGLGGWTVDTRALVNPATFSNPDWAVVSPLPDRAGSAAFVEDSPDIGDCVTDIEAGVLYLESPVISIPAGASNPAIAFDHWVATEAGWDGGNVKISTNGGSFSLVRSNKFTFNAYNSSIIRAQQGAANDNPLGGEAAFTGTDGGKVSGSWGQSQIGLSAGDDVQIRFEMGLDGCFGVIGWYVDDVHVHECGGGGGGVCGDDTIDAGETCDGTDLGGETCISQGCTGGTLACAGDCSAFDNSACTGCPVCVPSGQGQPCDASTNCCSGVGNCTGGKPSNRVCN